MLLRIAPGILAFATLLSATPSAMGQRKAVRDNAAAAKTDDQVNVLYKMFPDYDAYDLSYEDYESKRISDVVEVNAILYDLTDKERSRIESLVQKLESLPQKEEESKLSEEKFAALINERAEITRVLIQKFDVDKAGSEEAQQLLNSSGLMKMQATIASMENARNESVNQVRPAIEAMIGPERTQAAYSQWAYRVDQARDRIALKSIVQTLRQPKEVREIARQSRETGRVNPPPPQEMKPVRPQEKANALAGKPKATARRTARRQNAEPKKGETAPSKRSTEKKPTATRRQSSKANAIPLDKWEQYVHDFIADYKCTPEQTHSALSILTELKDRAEVYEKSGKKRLDAANEIKDRKEREKRINEINAPIDRLFEQLKRRLDGLLTTHQRAIKEAAAPSTRKTKRQ